MNPRRLRLIGVGLTAITCTLCVWHAEFLSAEVRFFGKKVGKPAGTPAVSPEQALQQAATDPLASDEAAPDRSMPVSNKQIKLNYLSKSWDDVLKDVAQQSGRQLVMDKVPPGRFSRNDWSRYPVSDAVKILNRDLESKGFRLLERGQYLDLVFLRDARSEYARPVVSSYEPPKAQPNINRTQDDVFLKQAAFNEAEENEGDELERAETPHRLIAVTMRHQTARNVSRSLYQAFEQHAELVEQGPNGFPGFVVWKDAPSVSRGPTDLRLPKGAPKRTVRFTIGVDTKADRLLIDGAPAEVTTVKKLVGILDVVSNSDDGSVRLVSTKRDPRQVARTLNSAVKQVAQARAADPTDDTEFAQADATAKPKKNAKKKVEPKPSAPTNPADPAKLGPDAEMQSPDNSEKSPFSGPLQGDVTVEELGDLLILRGNEKDLEAVMRLINEIERMLAGSVPDVNVRPLKHVDSESMADLLTTVYERLNRSRGRSATDLTQQIVVIAIGKPNAVMVLASERDLPTVDMLIEKLDQPVDPTNEFEVFRLRYAVASQIVTAIESFFTGGGAGGQATTPGTTARTTGGLRGNVKAISDSRTNSVIVQARSRDLEEVRRLIGELDQVGSKSVNQIKLIPLKNAVADDMANLLNLAFQSVIGPPQQPRTTQGGAQGGGQGALGGAGGGQVDQKLREAKSAVLQLLDTEDGEAMVESGILADIRINSDPHTNSLIVTAPEESLAMIQALVKRFDKPSSMVAEIKHFTLRNADASSIVTMLNTLFNNQQQGGQRAGGQQNQQLGIQLSGAEDASSQLIPLKFSTDIRTNSIIAVGGADALSVVEAIILRLDASDARQRTMNVFRLKNSPAAEVATAITLFLQGQQNLAAQGNQNLVSDVEQLERQIVVVAEANSNSLLISATPRYLKDVSEMIERIDSAKPEVVIQALLVEVALDNTDEFGVELGFQDSILFDRSNIASGTGITGIQNITQQVIQLTQSTTTSVTPGTGATTTTTTVTPQSLTTSTPNIVGSPGFQFNSPTQGNNIAAANPGQVGSQGLSNFSVGRTNGNLGFGGLVLSAGSESVNVLLRALSATRRVEILSRPQIRTLDSQLGTINVGQIVPVVTGASANAGIAGGFIPIITRDPSGILLEVTPRITPDDRIVMQVHAERSKYDLTPGNGVIIVAASAAAGAITSPVKDISTALTTVSIANEQTIVLGGLIQKTDDAITRKVPWLGDIPILGQAFRFDSHNLRRTELLIFLTPRIVKNNSVSEILKQIESERLHYSECEAEALHGPLFGIPESTSDSSVPPVYRPGELWSPSNSAPTPPPPAPIDNAPSRNEAPRVLPVPPMNDATPGDVQGANFQNIGSYNRTSASPISRTSSSGTIKKTIRKPTILDTFRRDKAVDLR